MPIDVKSVSEKFAHDKVWESTDFPANVVIPERVVVVGLKVFSRFLSELDDALIVGSDTVIDNTRLSVGKHGRLVIGSNCYFSDAVIIAQNRVTVGSQVRLSWGVTIADCDFHPLDPELRRLDAVACSHLPDRPARAEAISAEVIIGDDVWIGPNASVLKGVTIADGAFIEPGSVVTTNVAEGLRVAGNPARVVDVNNGIDSNATSTT